MDSNELQLEELEAIEAIYMDDYSRNKKTGPAEFVLQLTPLQSMTTEDVHAKLNLRVVYTTKYPYDPPILKLEKVKGISDENIAQLKAKLDKLAVDLCGEVMVLQLAHHIQAFLHSHNKPNLSFFEQMLQNQTQMEEKEQREQLKLKQQKCEEDRLKDEAIMRQVKKELVKREVLKDKRKRQISQSSPMNSFSERSSGDAVATATTFTCSRNKDRKMSVVVFKNQERKLFCSACIGHFFPGACTLTGIEENSGKLMSIIEWKAKVSKKNVSADTKQDIAKQIQSIEQEFYFLSNKIACNGLANYLMLDTNQDNTSLAIKMLCDSVQGTPLSSYLCTAGASLSFIHHVCTQLVPVLLYMHNKSVVHKDLNLCNTMVTCSNDILVSGYAIVYRVSEFVRQYAEDDVIEYSFAHLQNYVKIGKKGDVFNMGLILLSLYTGVTDHEFPVSIPNDVPEPFKAFLEKCLEVDESKRFTIHQASQHRFLLEKVNPGIGRHEMTNLHGGGGGEADEKQEASADMLAPLLWNGRVLLGKSRLMNEFGDFEWLGKGGFGSVLKVRNKLDSNFYAIKRVPLNPKSLNLNKRITREVKLLSRLNHENVVRYFNSWIEAEDVTLPSLESTTDSDSIMPPQHNNQPKKPAVLEERRPLEESLLGKIHDDFDFGKDEREATEDFSWADISEPRAEIESSSSSSSFEDSEAVQRRINLSKRSRSTRKESSEGVVFEVDDSVLQFGDELDSEDSDEEVTTTPTTQTTTESSDDSSATLQYLYIQMEFCEKLTLRTAIDEDLYQQPDRAWKLFREIVEGIAHVHAQGIIHRDLKPVNIFMDSSDRIKIGDFGLATSHGTVDTSSLLQNNHSNLTDEKMTGKVGTTLYVAPELGRAHSRVKFSHKVDMYSLGIIMFEMFYRPLSTGMERVNTIAALRSESVVFPEDFMPGKKQTKVRVVINWLLKHDAEGRPTSQELLESGYVPPKMEDSQMDELIKHTLQQSNSTRYQRLVSAFFAQKVSPVADQIYDSDFYGKNEEQVSKRASILQNVQDTLQGVFRKHGGVFMDTPLLTPRGKAFENTSKVATVIDASGLQLCLPYDSRVSFARYVTRNNITNMRRYCLGKLYRDQGMRGAHPVALWDCSFDIVSDSFTSCLPEAELIYIVCEIIYEFPALAQRNFFIRLNHMSFMKAIFLQNNFSDSTEQDIMSILEHTRERKLLENELKNYFMSMGLTDHYTSKLLNYFMFEGSLAKAKEALQGLRKTKQNVSNCAKQAFACIERTLKHLSNMEVELPVQISTSLVPNAQHYSGLVFQFVAENTRKKRHGGYDILAVGGCYDRLVTSMSKYAELTELPRSVGVSIAVEKIIAAVQKTCDGLPNNSVIVCSLTGNIQQLVQVLHELWSTGISASLFSYEVDQNYTVEEIQEHCKEKGINHIVIIKESQPNFVRVKSREKDKFSEIRILPRKELCDYLHQKNSVEVPVKDMEALHKVTSLPPPSQGAMYESLFFTFVSIDKIDSGKKKRFENSFRSKFYNEAVFRNSEVQVVVAKLDLKETRAVAAHVELSRGVEEFEASVRSLIDMFKEQGAFMRRVCNTLFKLYSETHALVVLYSYIEEYYRIVS